jgi:hypothetical protein
MIKSEAFQVLTYTRMVIQNDVFKLGLCFRV